MAIRRKTRIAFAPLLGIAVLMSIAPELVPLPVNTAEAQYYGTSRRVARRTSRRTSYRHEAWDDSADVVAVPGGAGYVTALPGGCTSATHNGVAVQQCGSSFYRPYYQGDSLVYVVVQ